IVHTLAASTAPSFVYPSCNSLVVKAVAEVALNKVNSNRKQGYVLGLQRIFDVHELPEEIAKVTLAKFNAESDRDHYFGLVGVTKGKLQVKLKLKYTIQETSCRKSPPVSDITQCPLLPTETAVIVLFSDSAKISKMALLISFLIGIQLFHAVASVPLTQFLHPSCNSLEVKTAAEVALNKHNKHQTDGYILGLQRIFDAYEVSEQDGDSVFFLILDVLETKCHVLSKKSWKECDFRHPYETVFGQCKVIIKFNRNSNDSFLYRNDCSLRPHTTPACPGCPIRQNASEDRFQEIAKESLAKFNAENGHEHYFAILKVTKANSQVVYGILNTVEFTIQETSCPKSTPVSDITQCSLLPTETAVKGLCKGSVIGRGDEGPRIVTANCQFFPHPSGSEHQELHHLHVNDTETSTKQKETVVSKDPSSEHAVPEVQEPNPNSSPTLASPEEKANSHLTKITIPAFPKGFSQSASCPGEMLHSVVSSPPFRFLPPMCNSSEVKVAAEVALNKLNAHRKEGYVLGLQRIFDVHEILQVYGQCKVIIHFNKNSNHSQLYSYDCVLRPPTFWETAAESLAKFNAESNHVHYFTILNVTKARSQWVIGPSNFVEYTIQETSCLKSQPVSIIAKCPLLPPNTAEAGLCKGSVVNSRIENRKFVTVKCHFFPHLPPVADEQTPQSGSELEQEKHHDDAERHRNHHEENRRHHQRSHPHHHHKHHGHKHEDQESHYPPRSANVTKKLPGQKEILGRVVIYPPSSKHVSLHSLPEVQEPKPTSKSRLTSQFEASPQSVQSTRPAIPPFPSGFSESPSCPGDLAIEINGLQLPSPS
ncbi:Fetuin-B, partial [Ophiophagus hannah]